MGLGINNQVFFIEPDNTGAPDKTIGKQVTEAPESSAADTSVLQILPPELPENYHSTNIQFYSSYWKSWGRGKSPLERHDQCRNSKNYYQAPIQQLEYSIEDFFEEVTKFDPAYQETISEEYVGYWIPSDGSSLVPIDALNWGIHTLLDPVRSSTPLLAPEGFFTEDEFWNMAWKVRDFYRRVRPKIPLGLPDIYFEPLSQELKGARGIFDLASNSVIIEPTIPTGEDAQSFLTLVVFHELGHWLYAAAEVGSNEKWQLVSAPFLALRNYEVFHDAHFTKACSKIGHPHDNDDELFASAHQAFYLHADQLAQDIQNADNPQQWLFAIGVWCFFREEIYDRVFTSDGVDPFADIELKDVLKEIEKRGLDYVALGVFSSENNTPQNIAQQLARFQSLSQDNLLGPWTERIFNSEDYFQQINAMWAMGAFVTGLTNYHILKASSSEPVGEVAVGFSTEDSDLYFNTFNRIAREHEDPIIRKTGLFFLMQSLLARPLNLLVSFLTDPHPLVRLTAVRYLTSFSWGDQQESADQILQWLQVIEEDEEIRGVIKAALEARQQVKTDSIEVARAKQEDPLLLNLEKSIYENNESFLDRAREFLNDPDLELAYQLEVLDSWMLKLRNEERYEESYPKIITYLAPLRQALRESLQHPNPILVSKTVEALRGEGKAPVKEREANAIALIGTLEHPDVTVRLNALQVLMIGDWGVENEAVQAAIWDKQHDEDSNVRRLVYSYLKF